MNRQVIGCVAAVVSVLSAFAGEKLWVGKSGGDWSVADNWQPAGVPVRSDLVVFRSVGEMEILVSSLPDGFSGMRFESGKTLIRALVTTDPSAFRFRFPSGQPTSEVYVAEGAYAAVSNVVDSLSSEHKTVLRKTGAGTLEMLLKWGNDWGKFAGWDFAEGVTIVNGSDGSGRVNGSAVVRSGAVLKSPRNYSFHATETWLTIERGGVWDWAGSDDQYVDGFSGGGVITNAVNSSQFGLKHGPYVFSGTVYPKTGSASWTITMTARASGVTDEAWKMVAGSTDAFSKVFFKFPNSEGSPLGFAPGIGSFNVYQIQNDNKPILRLEDTEGNPITLTADWLNPAKIRLEGAGTFYNVRNERSVTRETTTDLSGLTGTLGAAGSTLNIGNNTSGKDPVLNPQMTIEAKGSGKVFIKMNNCGKVVVTNNITGDGTVGFYGDVTLLNANTDNAWWQIRENCNLKLLGGFSQVGGGVEPYNMYFYSGCVLDVCGARIEGVSRFCTEKSWSALKRRWPFPIQNGAVNGALIVRDGGSVFINGYAPKSIDVLSGGTLRSVNLTDFGDRAASNPLVITVDGGTMIYPEEGGSPYTLTALADSDKNVMRVGAKGMRMDIDQDRQSWSDGTHQVDFKRTISSGVSDGKDGGIVRTGGGILRFYHPLEITGGFDNRDGVLLQLNVATIRGGDKPLYGTGDFRLGNAIFAYATDVATAYTSVLAGGDARLVAAGGATVRLLNDKNSTVQTLKINELAYERGGALFFWSNSDAEGHQLLETVGKVYVDTVPALAEDGRLLAPVFSQLLGPDIQRRRLGFLSYDADKKQLCSYRGYKTIFGADAGDVVRLATKTDPVSISASTTVAGLVVEGDYDKITSATAGKLTVADGVTLTISGQDGHPGCLLMNNATARYPAAIVGGGTLDFGENGGLIAVGDVASAGYPAAIYCNISGSAGLNIVAAADDYGHELMLSGDNTFTGGLTVNAAFVQPKTSTALATGLVTLGDGELAGGGLRMATEGLTISNPIRAAGWGTVPDLNNDASTAHGAIQFDKSGTLSGPVEAYAPLRIRANAGEGEFSGVISGDRLQLWNGSGKIVFTANNTYTGGTEVVNAILVLRNGGRAGTGEITLDKGTLEVDNEENTTVLNPVRGVGTVRLVGRGSVHFAEVAPQNSAGFTLDLTKKVTTVDTLDGFGKITTGRTRPTHLIVADGKGRSFAGEVPENVTIYDPGEYTPPGLTLILR